MREFADFSINSDPDSSSFRNPVPAAGLAAIYAARMRVGDYLSRDLSR